MSRRAPLFTPWYVPYNRWVLCKEVSSTIFWVFNMTRPRIEPRSPGSQVNTPPTSQYIFQWEEFHIGKSIENKHDDIIIILCLLRHQLISLKIFYTSGLSIYCDNQHTQFNGNCPSIVNSRQPFDLSWKTNLREPYRSCINNTQSPVRLFNQQSDATDGDCVLCDRHCHNDLFSPQELI